MIDDVITDLSCIYIFYLGNAGYTILVKNITIKNFNSMEGNIKV